MENEGINRSCPACTFINMDSSRASCEICAGPLPAKRRVEIDLTNDDDEDEPQRKAPRRALEAAPPQSSDAGSGKDCPICMDKLGTEGGVQALGCMCCFCRTCIATSVGRQQSIGETVTCPICRYEIPEAEQRTFRGHARQLEDSDDEDDEAEEGDEEGDEGEEGEEGEEGSESESSEDDGPPGGWVVDGEGLARWVPWSDYDF